MRLGSAMWKRQNQGDLSDTAANGQFSNSDDDSNDNYEGPTYDSWWWSPTGMAVRYTVIIFLFASLLLFFLGGYLHAQRRMRRGLPLMRYHAWMVRRAYRQPQYQHPQAQQQNGYPMQGYAPAPPPYNPYSAPPPAYQPPEGAASKVLADQQNYAQVHRLETQGESSTMAPPAAVARQ